MARSIFPTTYLTLCVILMVGLDFVYSLPVLGAKYNLLGGGLIILGIFLNLWADQIFKKERTTVKPNETPGQMIVKGPFKVSRNPMYLGMVLGLLGIAILLDSAISFLFPILFVLIIERKFIPVEEQALEKRFGKEYLNYKKRVRR